MLIRKQCSKLILPRDGNTTMFFIMEEAKEIILDISQEL